MVDGSNISHLPGIYLHIPFCEKKCDYCDFYSTVSNKSRELFLNALLKEMQLRLSTIGDMTCFDTIYIGGGTPSLLGNNELEKIFSALFQFTNFEKASEITIEVNPESVTRQKLLFYKALGITRLSIGVQSFHEADLEYLGRIHTVNDAIRAYRHGREAGFDNISIDLIYGLPDQSLEAWQESLHQAIALKPDHISAYNLIVEEGTPLHERLLKGKVVRKSSDEEYSFLQTTINVLQSNGYMQYEISSFVLDKSTISRHNYKYWNHSPYLGFGPSAHSLWERNRWSNIRSLNDYINMLEGARLPLNSSEYLDETTMLFERIFLSLRTVIGIDLSKFNSDFGTCFQDLNKPLTENLIREGLAVIQDEHFRLTQRGLCISDEIISNFAPV